MNKKAPVMRFSRITGFLQISACFPCGGHCPPGQSRIINPPEIPHRAPRQHQSSIAKYIAGSRQQLSRQKFSRSSVMLPVTGSYSGLIHCKAVSTRI